MRNIIVLSMPLVLCACGAMVDSSIPESGVATTPAAFEGPVPKAECGPGSVKEKGLQGQVSMEERTNGASRKGYSCNLEQVAAFEGDGAGWGFAWLKDCAYYSTNKANNTSRPAANVGTVALDVANAAGPTAMAYLPTPSMLDPAESLKVNAARGLLAGAQSGGNGLDLYDVSDCRQPIAVFGGSFTGASGHAGDFSQDGQTFYSVGAPSATSRPYAWDVSDPSHAEVIALPGHFPTNTSTGDLSTNADGSRMYLSQQANGTATLAGLAILDVTDIKERKKVPRPKIVGTLADASMDGSTPFQAKPIRIKGKPYILFTNEQGNGAARLIDISDETAPFVVSKLKLEVHMAGNANTIAPEVNRDRADGATYIYQAQYCGVDNPENVTAIACSYFQSGIRVFDVRDPSKPKEIAYFSPPLPAAGATRNGSSNASKTKDAAFCTSEIRFIPDKGELWATCQDNGFMVLRFTNDVWPFKN